MKKEIDLALLGKYIGGQSISLIGQRTIILELYENGYLILAKTGKKVERLALTFEAFSALVSLYESNGNTDRDTLALARNVDMPTSDLMGLEIIKHYDEFQRA